MRNAITKDATALALVIGLVLAASPGAFAAEDLLDKLKKAAEQIQSQQRQRPQQQPAQQQRAPQQSTPQAAPAQPGSSSAPVRVAPPGDCCTPEATAKIAAAAGFFDIVGIKLGMPAQQAIAAIKAAIPNATISTAAQTGDYERAFWGEKPQDDPKNRWITNMLAVGATGEQINIGITTPPNPPVVNSIARTVSFPQPLAVDNVVAGLRKKYGPESFGPDFRLSGMLPFDQTNKIFLWYFDAQGRQLRKDEVAKHYEVTQCNAFAASDMGAAKPMDRGPVGRRWYEKGGPPNIPDWCKELVILEAQVYAKVHTAGITGMTYGMEVVAYHYPLMVSAATAMYAFIDQKEKEFKAKQMEEAQKRGGVKF